MKMASVFSFIGELDVVVVVDLVSLANNVYVCVCLSCSRLVSIC